MQTVSRKPEGSNEQLPLFFLIFIYGILYLYLDRTVERGARSANYLEMGFELESP